MRAAVNGVHRLSTIRFARITAHEAVVRFTQFGDDLFDRRQAVKWNGFSYWPNESAARFSHYFTILKDGLSPQNCADNAAAQLATKVGRVAMTIEQLSVVTVSVAIQVHERKVRVLSNFDPALLFQTETLRHDSAC